MSRRRKHNLTRINTALLLCIVQPPSIQRNSHYASAIRLYKSNGGVERGKPQQANYDGSPGIFLKQAFTPRRNPATILLPERERPPPQPAAIIPGGFFPSSSLREFDDVVFSSKTPSSSNNQFRPPFSSLMPNIPKSPQNSLQNKFPKPPRTPLPLAPARNFSSTSQSQGTWKNSRKGGQSRESFGVMNDDVAIDIKSIDDNTAEFSGNGAQPMVKTATEYPYSTTPKQSPTQPQTIENTQPPRVLTPVVTDGAGLPENDEERRAVVIPGNSKEGPKVILKFPLNHKPGGRNPVQKELQLMNPAPDPNFPITQPEQSEPGDDYLMYDLDNPDSSLDESATGDDDNLGGAAESPKVAVGYEDESDFEDPAKEKQRNAEGTWKESQCILGSFDKCLNGGYCIPIQGTCVCKDGFNGLRCQNTKCGATHTLINGTCDAYDLLILRIQAPGLKRYLRDQNISLKEISSHSQAALGARSFIRSHIYERMVDNGPKISIRSPANAEKTGQGEQYSIKESNRRSKRSAEYVPKPMPLSSRNDDLIGATEVIRPLDDEILGVEVEWFDTDGEIDAKIKLSLPLGTGWDIDAWENRLAAALKDSMILDWTTIQIEDFDECATEVNRCRAKNSVICENLPGSYQCRCLGSKQNHQPTCRDPCLTTAGEPYCLNKGRCKPALKSQTLATGSNAPGQDRWLDWPSLYGTKENVEDDEFDYATVPACYCTDNYHGNRCQFEYVDDSTLLISVWIIAAICFAVIVGFLIWKIYKLVQTTADDHSSQTRTNSLEGPIAPLAVPSRQPTGRQQPQPPPPGAVPSHQPPLGQVGRSRPGTGPQPQSSYRQIDVDADDVEILQGAFGPQRVPRHIYAFY